MRMMTALALIIVSVPAAYAADPFKNDSFIEQIGSRNDATISQKNGNNGQATFQAGKNNSVITDQVSNLAAGKNLSGNVQVGKGNTAFTLQTNTPPNADFTTATYTNKSFSAQFGVKNDVIVGQNGGQNNQDTLQAGDRNESGVVQTNKSATPASASPVGAANTSFTGQFGKNNLVGTSQISADGTDDFGKGPNPVTATRLPRCRSATATKPARRRNRSAATGRARTMPRRRSRSATATVP